MSAEKKILELVPAIQSVGLVSNLHKKKKPVKDAVETIFGINLIKLESDIIGEL